MASKSGKTTVDLRSLMQKQRQQSTANVKKVDSPLARYNSLGQITCIVCGIPIKSEIIWNAHVQGKKHRQNIENLKSSRKSGESAPSRHSSSVEKPTLPSSSKLKRKSENDETEASPPKKTSAKTTSSSTTRIVPPVKVNSERKKEQQPPKKEVKESSAISMKDALPEGFFDDPTVDAKVRKVEVKNTAEEEWSNFLKEMEQQQQASEVILAADEEATQVTRNITEIDEQIQRFAKIEKLRDQQDEWKVEKLAKINELNQDTGSSEDEEEYAEFLDWRSKGAFK